MWETLLVVLALAFFVVLFAHWDERRMQRVNKMYREESSFGLPVIKERIINLVHRPDPKEVESCRELAMTVAADDWKRFGIWRKKARKQKIIRRRGIAHGFRIAKERFDAMVVSEARRLAMS